MATWQIVLIVITVLMLAATITLYILGKKSQKKKEEQDAQIAAAAQTISMLIIDKKRMKMKDAGLPAAVLAQTPKLLRGSKLPVVKAKVGPKIMTLMADERVFALLPVKAEAKVVVSGIYITEIKSVRGGSVTQVPKKKGFFARFKKDKDAKKEEPSKGKGKKSKS